MLIRRSAAAVAALVLTFSLAACGGSQTVDEACEIANSEAEAALEKFQAIDPSDPAAAAKQVNEMATELNKIADGLKNDEVQESLSDIAGSFEKLQAGLEELDAAGDDNEAREATAKTFNDIGQDMSNQREAFTELCG